MSLQQTPPLVDTLDLGLGGLYDWPGGLGSQITEYGMWKCINFDGRHVRVSTRLGGLRDCRAFRTLRGVSTVWYADWFESRESACAELPCEGLRRVMA